MKSSQDSSPKTSDHPARGFRGDIRRALYLGIKDEYPGIEPVEEPPSPLAIRRIKLVLWLEGLIAAGCHFAPDDLHVSLWEALSDLKAERNRVERLTFDYRQKKSEGERQVAKAQADARKMDNLPSPGQSIFSRGRR